MGTVLGSGFYTLAAQIGRHSGKQKEKSLFDTWGGKPTTQLLRHRGPVNVVRLSRIHRQLEALTNLSMPALQEEVANPSSADAVDETAIDVLRDRTRDRKVFPLVFQELCHYGFRRNVWGLRPWGIGIAAVVMTFAGISLGLGAAQYDVPRSGAVFVLLTGIAMVWVWSVVVTPRWVEQTAIAYAERLLDAVENLARTSVRLSSPTSAPILRNCSQLLALVLGGRDHCCRRWETEGWFRSRT